MALRFFGLLKIIMVFASLAFLLAPVILVFPMSFSADSFIAWPPSGWSLRWYVTLSHNAEMMQALRNSFFLALIVTGLTLIIALPASVVLARKYFLGADFLLSLFTAPLLLPSIVLGLAILIIFVGYGMVGSWQGMIIAHLVLTLPYALRVLIVGLKTLPPSLEEAALMLGAHPLIVFRRVTLPLMLPALIACSALAFIISFDEVVVSLFVSGTQLKFLPVALYNYVESRSDPLVAAASALMVSATLVLVLLIERAVGLRKTVGG